MSIPLRVLLVEDSLADAELTLAELRRGGYQPLHERVDTPVAMQAALDKQTWDIILSDYVMPCFSGPEALKIAKERATHVPFIVVTGQIGEATAIETLTAGAHDYIMKGSMARLASAVQRVLQDAVLRRERREAIEALHKAHEELRLAHAELERRVEERTTELASANQELQESEERWRLIVRNSPDTVFRQNRDLRYLWVANPTPPLTEEQVMGKTDFDLVPADEVERVAEIKRGVLDTGAGTTFEVRVIISGEVRWYDNIIEPWRDAEGAIVGLVGYSREITERKRAEEALRESEEKYRSLFTNIPSGYAFCEIVLDDKGEPTDFVYLEVNDAFERLTGLRREDVVGKKVTDAIPGIKEGNPEIIPIYGKVALTGKPAAFEVLFEPLGIWLTISVYRPKQGFFVAVFDNTTKRKNAEERLRESEEKYRTLFNSIDEGFCIIEVLFDEHEDPVDYRFLEVNAAFERQTGIENAVGRRVRDFLPQHEEYWFEIYGKVALTGEPVRFENLAEQLHRYYDVYAFRIGEPAGRKVAVLFNDITDRKRAEAERERLA